MLFLIVVMRIEQLEAEKLQALVAKLIASSQAGVNLLLIGGFRYRLLDGSKRFSVDMPPLLRK